MSTLNLATIQSNTALPPTIQNSSAVEIGTFCRAWVNFNGTGTVAIRASFNVTSITDNGVGDYTVNFTTAMSDTNYSVCGSAMRDSANIAVFNVLGSATYSSSYATTSIRINCRDNANSSVDAIAMNVGIFR